MSVLLGGIRKSMAARCAVATMLFLGFSPALLAQVSLTTPGTAVLENFDTLAATGTSGTLPVGWALAETGTNANATYTAGTGSANGGDSYSFGAAAATERALGGVQSGSLIPSFGAQLQNNTGGAINALQIGYTGEQWRVGALARTDRIDFQYSTDATSLITGTWIDVNTLDFSAPTQAGAVGSLDGNLAVNRIVIAPVSISGLNVANGASVWIRWQDFNATGADDGVAIDDVTITPAGTGTAIGVSVNDVTVTEGNAGTSNASFIITLSAPATAASSISFATTDNTATAPSDYTSVSQVVNFAIGESSKTVDVPVLGDTTVEPNESFNVTLSAPVNLTIGDGAGLGTITNDDFVVTAINAIQGTGLTSPLNGTTVTIEGVVTGVKTNGFFVQSITPDANPATSEGILVFTGAGAVPASVVRGAGIRVTGAVLEFVPTTDTAQPPTTELVAPLTITQLSLGNPLPATVPLPTINPAGDNNQLENLEHMRVSLSNATVVAGTRGFVNEANATGSTNGVFWITTGATRPRREPGIDIRETLIAGMPAGVPRFDGNPETVRVDSDAQVGALALELTSGQVITAVDGVLDYGLRFYTFLPDPAQTPTISPAAPANSALPAGASEFTVASYNLQRFFDTVNDPLTSDVVLTAAAYANRLSKASRQIRVSLGAPDIIAVIEMEDLTTLQALAAQIAADGGPTYSASLFDGNDPGGIDVGYLVKTQAVVGATPRVSSVTTSQVGLTATYLNPTTNMQDTLNDRPPVLLTATINSASGGTADVAVIVNHLRSFLGVTDPVDGPRIRAKRLAQAEFLANLVQTRQVANPNERLVVVGDFNAYEFNDGYVDVMGSIIGAPTPATQVLLAGADLVNPNMTRMADASADYSYSFDGFTQNIDHILVSQGLINNSAARSLTHVRLNADYPETQRSDYTATAMTRLSDHDALVLRVSVPALGVLPTSCVLSSTTVNPIVGAPVSYTVALTPNTATGSVVVTALAGESCNATVSAGNAVCTITYNSSGARTINAAFTGTAGSQNTTCGPLNQTIGISTSMVTLLSSVNPSVIGQSVALNASVTGINPTGNVEFLNGAVVIGTSPLTGTGNTRTAALQTSILPVGNNVLTARYVGDANNAAMTSALLTQVVSPGATSTAISVNPNPPVVGQPLTISASVSVTPPAVGPATGTVSFLDGTTVLGTAPLTNGVATITIPNVPIGNHSYRVRYEGSASFLTSTSSVVGANFVVQAPTLSMLGLLLLVGTMVGFGIGASSRSKESTADRTESPAAQSTTDKV
jgi:uncharacterized protein